MSKSRHTGESRYPEQIFTATGMVKFLDSGFRRNDGYPQLGNYRYNNDR